MATKTLILTEDEYRAIAILVNNAWHDADNKRMLTRPDSSQEKAAEADQLFWQQIRVKLTGRDSVPATR